MLRSYCLFNVAVTVFILYLLSQGIDSTIDEFGNEFMRLLASFRDVSRFTIALGLYFDFRGYCSQMF